MAQMIINIIKIAETEVRIVTNIPEVAQDLICQNLIKASKHQLITSLVDPQVSILSPKYGFLISSVLLSQ